MTESMPDKDRTIEAVTERIVAALQEAGVRAVAEPGYRGVAVASDSDSGHERVKIEVDCARTSWGSPRDLSLAKKIKVSITSYPNGGFKALSYPVEKGNFNKAKIVERVKKGLEVIKSTNESREKAWERHQSTERSKKQELKDLEGIIEKSGAQLDRRPGDRARYDVSWHGTVDLDQLKALLQALADAGA
jgi:hypothetical protein